MHVSILLIFTNALQQLMINYHKQDLEKYLIPYFPIPCKKLNKIKLVLTLSTMHLNHGLKLGYRGLAT